MNKNKRKAVLPELDMLALKATVTPLLIEDMIINIPGKGSAHFKKLKYKGCPNISSQTLEFNTNQELICMGRESFVREMYQLMKLNVSQSTSQRFYNLIDYLRWMDSNELLPINGDYFHGELLKSYMAYWSKKTQKGVSKNLWNTHRAFFSWLLKQKNRSSEAKKLKAIRGSTLDINPQKALDLETELKPITKQLFKSYRVFKQHFVDGIKPKIHPLYDKVLFDTAAKKQGWSIRKKSNYKSAFRKTLERSTDNNPFIQVSMMLCFMFTGMNLTPLSRVKIKDLIFKEVQGGKYIIEAQKDRANYLEIDNSLGFSKHAKEFIENWKVIVFEMVNRDDNAPLFPYFTQNGNITTFEIANTSPQAKINKLLGYIGLPTITAGRFRKTKLDTLLRVTESIYLVAIAANNSIQVISKNYSNGLESDHENSLAASLNAKFEISKGGDLKKSVSEAKFKFSDVLDDYEYKNLRLGKDRSHESRTPTGVRCTDNTQGAAQIINRNLQRLEVTPTNDEIICTDFLDCFECESHALVADTQDIWLMLSFKDTLQQLQQTPAINSMPNEKYSKVFNTIESILYRFAEKSNKNYKKAEELHKESVHPLYATVYSLNDLLEVFS